MPKTSFDEFVEREQHNLVSDQSKPVDWQAEKIEWLKYLGQLHAQLREYLETYISAGQISISTKPVTLNEEYIGSYSADEMTIQIGAKSIRIEPIGTLLIGTKGRVDVVGPYGKANLWLLDKNVKSVSDMVPKFVSVSINGKALSKPNPKRKTPTEWTWKVITRPPNREILDMDKSVFLNLLVEVSNG